MSAIDSRQALENVRVALEAQQFEIGRFRREMAALGEHIAELSLNFKHLDQQLDRSADKAFTLGEVCSTAIAAGRRRAA